MNRKKVVLSVLVVFGLLFTSIASGFVFKIYGVHYSSLNKVTTVETDDLNKINDILVNNSLPPELLYGFSGTPTNQTGLDQIIGNMTTFGMNTYRISFTPEWDAGTRPYNVTQMTYYLNNTPASWYLIVDRNHQLNSSAMDWANWQQANQSIYDDILAYPQLANNSRVIIEIINEYVFNGSANVWAGTEWIVDGIQADGYTNPLLINKHTNANDWAQGAAIPYDYYGHHSYFNNIDDPANGSNTLGWAQNLMIDAMGAGATPLVNTEIGADFREFTWFNQTKVDVLKEYILWCRTQNIGNMIWMNKNVRNLPTYIAFDLFEGL